MRKRRVTLSLDEDVVEALESLGGRSVSAAANEALRNAMAVDAHRRALLRWLDQLDVEFGAPSPADLAAADEILDTAEAVRGGGETAG